MGLSFLGRVKSGEWRVKSEELGVGTSIARQNILAAHFPDFSLSTLHSPLSTPNSSLLISN